MSVYDKGKVTFHVKNTVICGMNYTGMGSVKIVECDATSSVILFIPARDPSESDRPVVVDCLKLDQRVELKADQRSRTVEICELPSADHPELPITVLLNPSVVYWAFMAAFTNAMTKFHERARALEDLVRTLINEDSDDNDDNDDNADHADVADVAARSDGDTNNKIDIKTEPGAATEVV